MTGEILFMLLLLAAALVLFYRETFPIEVTALGLLGTLLATGRIGVDEALAGFSNKAVVAIGALFVLSHSLFKSGMIETAAVRVSRLASERRGLAIAGLLAGVSLLSGFLNNTAVVAILIPLALDVCRRLEISPTPPSSAAPSRSSAPRPTSSSARSPKAPASRPSGCSSSRRSARSWSSSASHTC